MEKPPLNGRRIAIIGAGPIGLEAALYAKALGADPRVYERGAVADWLERWGHIELFTPFGLNCSPLARGTLEEMGLPLPDEGEALTASRYRRNCLIPLATSAPLAGRVMTGARVVTVGRGRLLKDDHIGDGRRANQRFRLLIETVDGEAYEEADIVLDCSGTSARPNWLGIGGVPAIGEQKARPAIDYHPIDIAGGERDRFIGRRVLLVGAGHSAATSAVALAELRTVDPSTRVLWVTRHAAGEPVPRIEDDDLPRRAALVDAANALVADGDPGFEWISESGVVAVHWLPDAGAFDVELQTPAGVRRERVDRVIANVGYEPNDSLYRGLQIHECYASRAPMNLSAALLSATAKAGGDCMKVGSLGPRVLANPEPDFYILGVKSYGRNPLFLLSSGYEQIRDVFRLITADAELDLYAEAKSTGAAATATDA